jgi:hypothetical protein
MSPDSQWNLRKQGLSELRGVIISAHCNVRKAGGSALSAAIRAGAALRSVRDRKLLRHGQTEAFYRETCSSVRTARDYISLAENREFILSQIGDGFADLGIGAALRLVRKANGVKQSKGHRAAPKEPPPPRQKSFDGWSDNEIVAALFGLGFSRFNRVIPPAFRARLAGRVNAQIVRLAQAQSPKTKLKDFVPRLVAGTDLEELPPTQH